MRNTFFMILLLCFTLIIPGQSFAAKGGKKGPSDKAYEKASDKAKFKRDSEAFEDKMSKEGKEEKEEKEEKENKEKKEKKEKKAEKEKKIKGEKENLVADDEGEAELMSEEAEDMSEEAEEMSEEAEEMTDEAEEMAKETGKEPSE